MMSQAIIVKASSFLAQILLAWLLLEQDFGLYGLALTVALFCRQFEQGGLREVLVQRQHGFDKWANPVFWISLATGLFAAGMMLTIAPVAALFYKDADPTTLVKLIVVLALASPISALSTVPNARLQIDMHFRTIMFIGVSSALIDIVFRVVFALLGFGAFSFTLPVVLAASFRTIAMWIYAPAAKLRWTPDFRRWKYLITDGMSLIGAVFFTTLVLQGDYIVLGRMQPPAVVGLYFFAYSLSTQTLHLLTYNLSAVLFPALSKLQDSGERQINAYLRAAQVLGVFAIPVCFGIAAVADPGVRALFPSRWFQAINLVQILSIGMFTRSVSWSAISLLRSQGRFTTELRLKALMSVIFFLLIVPATWAGAATGLAYAVALFELVTSPIYMYIALADAKVGWKRTLQLYLMPAVASIVSFVASVLAANALPLPAMPARDWMRLTVTISVFVMVYRLLMRRFAPEVWHDTVKQFSIFISRQMRGRTAQRNLSPVKT